MADIVLQAKAQSRVSKPSTTGKNKVAFIGFILSWIVLGAILILVPTSQSLTAGGRASMAVMGWATMIWLTGGLPLAISGLGIPLLLLLTGARSKMPEAFSRYTQDVTFLILGCFILVAVMQTTGLDRRSALGIVSKVKPNVGSVLNRVSNLGVY